MSLQVINIPARGHKGLVDLTESDCAGTIQYIKPFKIARVALVAGLVNTFNFNWQNPESVAIMVTNLVVHVVTGGTAGADIDAGTAAAADTASDNLLDGQDLGTDATWLNSFTNQATNGRCSQYMNANGGATDYICGKTLLQSGATLSGYAYIFYIPLA